MDTSSEPTGAPLRRLVVRQVGVENQYSRALFTETGYEKPNYQHLLSKVSQHLSSDGFPKSAHPPITRQLKPDRADTSPYAVANSLIRGSSRGLLGQ